jgi:VWFA-related protein
MRNRVFIVLTSLALAAIGAAAQQPPAQPSAQPPARPQGEQQPPVVFKVEANYVEIDAVVTDANGKFVGGLTRDDFQVFEQTRPQTISVFSLVDIPVTRPDGPLFAKGPIEPDVRSNREFDGRVFVLVLDDLHTATQRSVQLRTAARQFVERSLGANDFAAVVTTGGSDRAAQNFTNNRQLLVRAIDAFMGQKLRPVTLEKLGQLQRPMPGGRGPSDPNEQERAYKARSTLATLRNVAEYLSGIRGRRKAVVFFSEGIDYDMTNVFQNRDASSVMEDMKMAIGSATQANVSFYAVDPRGLSGFEDAIEITSLPEDNSLGVHTLQSEMRLAQDTLRTLAEETGGFAIINRNDYRDTFARIIQDNSSYYVLGYYTDSKTNGFRAIDVRVKRPGLQVRARKGYMPPRRRTPPTSAPASSGTSPALREALSSPLPVSGLGLTATAAAFRGAGGKASVAVTLEVDGTGFQFTEKGDRSVAEVEISMVAYDARGTGRGGGRDAVTLTLRPETRAAVIKRGVRIMRRFELAPGAYQVRIGAREANSGGVGTVMLDMEVPDFSKPPLAVSGIVVTSSGSTAVPTARADEQFKDVLPSAPTTIRDYGRDEEIATFAEIYDNQTRTPHRVEIKTTVLADDGQAVFTRAEERRSEELGPAGGGYGHASKIPLKDFAPGRYVLRVEARSLLSNGGTGMRELEFRVR